MKLMVPHASHQNLIPSALLVNAHGSYQPHGSYQNPIPSALLVNPHGPWLLKPPRFLSNPHPINPALQLSWFLSTSDSINTALQAAWFLSAMIRSSHEPSWPSQQPQAPFLWAATLLITALLLRRNTKPLPAMASFRSLPLASSWGNGRNCFDDRLQIMDTQG